MDSSERKMNPVTMTIINPWNKYLPSRGSNQRPTVLKSAMLPTELWGSAVKKLVDFTIENAGFHLPALLIKGKANEENTLSNSVTLSIMSNFRFF